MTDQDVDALYELEIARAELSEALRSPGDLNWISEIELRIRYWKDVLLKDLEGGG